MMVAHDSSNSIKISSPCSAIRIKPLLRWQLHRKYKLLAIFSMSGLSES